MSDGLPEGVQRELALCGTLETITISDPDLIRRVSQSPDISRPASDSLPAFFSFYFKATKFYSATTGDYFVGFQNDARSCQETRTAAMHDALRGALTPERVAPLAELLKSDPSDAETIIGAVRFVAGLFVKLDDGEQVPDHIARAAAATFTDTLQLSNPINYLRARRARWAVEQYVARKVLNGMDVADVAHNFGAAAQGLSAALLLMKKSGKGKSVKDLLFESPVAEKVIRMPNCTTTLDGLFPQENPLQPRKSIIVLQIASAATATADDRFLFGTGVDVRQCPFKSVLFSFVEHFNKS